MELPLERRIPTDIIEMIYSFCNFEDILAMSSASKAWNSHCVRELDACKRHSYVPVDKGSGRAIGLDLSREDWRSSVLAREKIFNCFQSESHAFTQLESIASLLEKSSTSQHVVEEAARWVVALFDEHDLEGACEFSDAAISNIVQMMSKHSANPAHFHILAKCLGVLALNESNRSRMAGLNAIHALTSGAFQFQQKGDIISCVCWALVILARPIGAVEGSTFLHTQFHNAQNIEVIVDQRGIQLVLETIASNRTSAETLAKAFWCMVNMSLYDKHKQTLIDSGGVQHILKALQDFPHHQELQYRACFAIINLAIKPSVKDMIRELGGIELVINGMKRFPKYLSFQKCACVVLRSLAWNSAANVRIICDMEGVQQIRTMMEHFSENRDMIRLGRTALQCLNAI